MVQAYTVYDQKRGLTGLRDVSPSDVKYRLPAGEYSTVGCDTCSPYVIPTVPGADASVFAFVKAHPEVVNQDVGAAYIAAGGNPAAVMPVQQPQQPITLHNQLPETQGGAPVSATNQTCKFGSSYYATDKEVLLGCPDGYVSAWEGLPLFSKPVCQCQYTNAVAKATTTTDTATTTSPTDVLGVLGTVMQYLPYLILLGLITAVLGIFKR